MTAIDPRFRNKLKKYGAQDFTACYNCGNCTAVCSLSTEEDSFPREMVRKSVLGMEGELKSSLKPWLCYYCGECSTHCPESASPGELMMSLRRYLTGAYDWTGLSGLLYRSVWSNAIAFILTAAVVFIFAFKLGFNTERMMYYGHYFEVTAIVAVFALILLPNVMRMWWFVIAKPGIQVPFLAYLKQAGDLFIHMFTQKRSLDCENNQFRWLEHFILVLCYLLLLFTTVVLDWFANQAVPVIILGYVVSFLIFVITFDFVAARFKGKKEVNRFTRSSDWLFVVWLFLVGITAFAVRFFSDTHLLQHNSWIYLVHLIVLAQWALIIVPFGKWTHFLYRSFAMYFARLKA
jgi:ferredoxin